MSYEYPLKLFDELLELNVICGTSVIIVPVNNERHMDDRFTIVFDPGGMIFSLLHQLNELRKKAKNGCWYFIFFVSIIPYSLDYDKTFEWTRRQFTRLLDVYWRNINFDVSDLEDTFLICSLLRWRICNCVGLISFPNGTVQRSVLMISGDVVEDKGSLITEKKKASKHLHKILEKIVYMLLLVRWLSFYPYLSKS